MIYWNNYKGHESKIITTKHKKFDNNIYTFDIEVTSYLKLKGKQYPQTVYEDFTQKQKDKCEFHSIMYIWMLGINDNVYYGRTWDELKKFLYLIDENTPEMKIMYIHNLSYEFQFLRSQFLIENVVARTERKVMKCKLADFNFELKCSYFLSNAKLEKLPEVYKLPVEKMVGDLDYSIIRTPLTPLTEKEMGYCENDCLVLYNYIKVELQTYHDLEHIPMTITGKVRNELKNIAYNNFTYLTRVRKAINVDPHVYNLLQQAFMGGYTHANYCYSDMVINGVDSYDFTSSYPYVMIGYKYPSSEFYKCDVKRREDMIKNFAYLLVVKFTNISSLHFNNFISSSKCHYIRGGCYDNGRLISALEIELTLTDIDFNFILDTHECEYEILESYYATYNYLPKLFYNFILDKYVKKTQLKNVEGKEIEYALEKGKFNSLYGMSVTNTIRDDVTYSNDTGWTVTELTNEEIIKKLWNEKKKGFLSFSYGVWVTAYARRNLLTNVCKLDEKCIYCDTDSLKLFRGYDKNVILDYNKSVKERIKKVSKLLQIPMEKYEPKDIKGEKHLLGVFEKEGEKYNKYTYDEFITQGAKKYAIKTKKMDKDGNMHDVIKITVAGVPKDEGAKALKDLNDFRDNFIFKSSDTGKQSIIYIDDQETDRMIDCNGVPYINTDGSGCCMIPCSYELGKSLDYCELLTDNSSKRAVFREEVSEYE